MEKTADFIILALQLCETNLQRLMDDNTSNIVVDELALCGDILRGLSHLHNLLPQAIAHRDLKPLNILISISHPNAKAKAIIDDLGLSKQLENATKETFSTTAGKAKGSRGWQAPEVLEIYDSPDSTSPRNRHKLSLKLDIFPTGCIMF